MSDERFSFDEEVAIAAPLRLDLDEARCDRFGCDQTATVIVRGAALCAGCMASFLVDDGRRYVVPFGELASDPEERRKRREQYASRLRSLRDADGGRLRSQSDEELLDAVIDDAVRAFESLP